MNKKLVLCLLLALKCSVQAQTNPWKSVALSGANAMVTGLYTVKGSADYVWIRTDVGGVYQYKSATSTWSPLNDTFTLDQADYYACDGFAVDPQIPTTLYYAGGLGHGRKGALFKSTNGGGTWQQLTTPDLLVQAGSSTAPLKGTSINGNGINRWAGERMAVCPSDSTIILYGSRRTGLWYSSDSGVTWARNTGIPASTSTNDSDADYGVQCVAFDPYKKGRVYCAVSGYGVYASDNYGKPFSDTNSGWTSLAGSYGRPQRLKVGPDGTVWYTTGDYLPGPTGNVIQKYANNTWSTYTPGNTADGIYCGLAINPGNHLDVIVQQGAQSHSFPQGKLWRTKDGGANWTAIVGDPSFQAPVLTSDAHWYEKPSIYRFSPADLAWDPGDTTTYSHVRGGQWYCANINAVDSASHPLTSWNQQEYGHEENVMLCLACPPTGAGTKDYELLEGSKDDRGLAWNKGPTALGTFPTTSLATDANTGPVVRIAYCESSPSHMMRTDNVIVSRSADGGDSWIKDTAFPAGLTPVDLAVCGTVWQAAVVICTDRAEVSSTGSAWSAVTWNSYLGAGHPVSAPMSSANPVADGWQVLAADHVNGAYYYFLDTNNVDANKNPLPPRVWVSSDRGVSFAVPQNAGTNLPASMFQYSIKSQPGTQGSVWISADRYPWTRDKTREGLYHSKDFGKTFTKLTNVDRALSFGFGIGDTPTSTPVLYIYGRMLNSTVDAPYFSPDLGATWTSMANPANNLSDSPLIMEGSRKTEYRVFVGTEGRGIFYSR